MAQKVCVIGGGFGGLSSACLLAHQGFQVTLLEKNDELGGRARVWREDGFVFDMGPSWYLMPEVFDRFFEKLGRKRTDYYELQKLNPFYRVFYSHDERVDINEDLALTRQVFEGFESGGAEKLDRYLQQAEYKYNIAMGEFLYREYRNLFQFLNRRLMTEGLRLNVFSSLDSEVSKYFSDRRAKQILEYAMVFLGASPSNAPALYSIMSHVDLNLGVYFPRGGMAALVEGMERLARELGVDIRTGHPVRKIVVENGKASHVVTDQGDVPADIVLSNADYAHTETELLEPRWQTYKERYWQKRIMAPTMFIIYLGLNKKLKSLAHHNLYFAEHWEDHFSAIFKKPAWPEHPSYYVSCASYDDAAVAPKGKENIFFLVPVAAGMDDTDDIRRRYADKILDHFEELTGETLRDAIHIMRIYSHRDFAEDYNAYKGSALGIAHTLNQTAVFRPQQRSRKVSNLYYAGQFTHPGVGVPMTFISAEIIAASIAEEHS